MALPGGADPAALSSASVEISGGVQAKGTVKHDEEGVQDLEVRVVALVKLKMYGSWGYVNLTGEAEVEHKTDEGTSFKASVTGELFLKAAANSPLVARAYAGYDSKTRKAELVAEAEAWSPVEGFTISDVKLAAKMEPMEDEETLRLSGTVRGRITLSAAVDGLTLTAFALVEFDTGRAPAGALKSVSVDAKVRLGIE